ncbi:2-oxo-4-hydroxy-4-carboxy-5-ureidoimidazoline decarboxylase [Leptolyngbya sp. FACHB-16]|nr:2-oxo-4-hydroxy-4-carboxy-5-ureidoimidazoline decarboxylase [Leptolyngbya sp. FACHB-8]MBD2155322.1 2-oxo-4-hydroxy-4-carboxy-5-ureidoimidazoline decarboxylase [Leptolyngbya sp. FACHB-16]
MRYTIADINQMNEDTFVSTFGELFEQTPAIAHTVYHHHPFTSLEALYDAISHTVKSLEPEAQLAFIRAHPDLGSKAKMADASVQEQQGAGLNQLTPKEFERFTRLNQTYKSTFGFPFIIAVRNHTKDSILEAFEQRLQNSAEQERDRALQEIIQIAKFRLSDRVEV